MAEDQQYKGELWNVRAIKLLDLFSWNKIGDSGMDLEGEDGNKYGVDCLYSYEDPAKNVPQSLILEAKSYATTSMNKATLQGWIDRLNTKISTLRGSEYLFERFPIFRDISALNIGIIIIWFSDTENYKEFRLKFLNMLKEVKVSSRPIKNSTFNKIYVIDNDLISKLCSIRSIINSLNGSFYFYYPSSFIGERAVERTNVLSLDYMLSKVILCQHKSDDNITTNVVFYFGELDFQSFDLLKSILFTYSFIDRDFKLVIYKYKRDDDEFRKISPDIINLYKKEGVEFEIKDMDPCHELPTFIIN